MELLFRMYYVQVMLWQRGWNNYREYISSPFY